MCRVTSGDMLHGVVNGSFPVKNEVICKLQASSCQHGKAGMSAGLCVFNAHVLLALKSRSHLERYKWDIQLGTTEIFIVFPDS